ncbi:MAG: TolC family protein [Candidatus Omnitrophota bacterium]|nr:TolC family protein [Candidatus Omnitrophota bacterium]
MIPVFFIAAGTASGCASVPARGGLEDVRKFAEPRAGARVHWDQGRPEDLEAAEAVRRMLADELSQEEAVQIALLNNGSLQATFEELGIAQADLVQAGLLQNPVFGAGIRFPHDPEGSTETDFSISQDLWDLLSRPLRTKLAAAEFEEAKLRVGDAAVNLAAEVRSAYVALQAAEHTHVTLQAVVQAAQAAAELAERQHAAGNINALDLAREQALFQESELEMARGEFEALAERERLNRLMGLPGVPAWKISKNLPGLPGQEPPLEDLEDRALTQRLDLAAARKEVEVLERNLVLVRRGIVPKAELGIEMEHEEGERATGPRAEVGLPLFDRRQGAIARAQAELRQGQRRLVAFETRVRSEVRSARDRLRVTRRMVERYRDDLIPLREKVVAESQKQYNFMLIGVFQLLQDKREEIAAYREYVEAFRDYWTARTDLEKAVGSRLPASQKPAAPQGTRSPHPGGHS